MNRPHSESYWLRGFNDGRQGKHETPPTNDPLVPAYVGYMNGYHAGRQKLNRHLIDQMKKDAA